MESIFEALKEANRQYPATKLVWIAIAISAASAVIASFGLGLTILLSSAGYIFITIVFFSFTQLVYRLFTGLKDNFPGARLLAAMIAWSSTFILLGSIVTFLLCLFLGWPRPFPGLIDAKQETQSTVVEVSEQPKIGKPLSNEKPSTTTTKSTSTNSDRLRRECLDGIDTGNASVEEAKAQARICLQKYGGQNAEEN